MKPKRYDAEFKRNAVELLLSSGKPLKPLASELGIDATTLRTWRDAYLKEIGGHPGRPPRGPSPEEMAQELRRLRKENATLTRQREILKKALGILSEQSPGDMP